MANSGLAVICEVGSITVGGQNISSANYTPTPNSGAVERPQSGERSKLGHKHKAGMDDVEMTIAGRDDYHGSFVFYHGEVPTVHTRVRIKNKTDQEIKKGKLKIKWFESPNHTFNPNHDHHFATDSNKHTIPAFKHNSHEDELVERKTNINHLKYLGPGVYYLYPVFYFEGEENIASEKDHHEYIKVTILPRYDVQITSIWINGVKNVEVGESLDLQAGVRNGLDHLPHDVRVGFYINGGNFHNKLFYAKVLHHDELGYQTVSAPTLAPLTPGIYTITVKVDDEGRLKEVDEGNNRKSLTIHVTLPRTNGKIDTYYGSTDPNNPRRLHGVLTQGYCLSGTPTALQGNGTTHNLWTWTCVGENGGSSETGYARKELTTAERMEILW